MGWDQSECSPCLKLLEYFRLDDLLFSAGRVVFIATSRVCVSRFWDIRFGVWGDWTCIYTPLRA